MEAKTQPKKKVDPYLGIKFLGYRISELPNPYSMKDLIRYAKFTLATKTHRLLKDPIWDKYTVEELLMEFYAHQFKDNPKFMEEFEAQIGAHESVVNDFASWADKQIAEEAKIRDKIMGGTEENVSFTPDMIMGETE